MTSLFTTYYPRDNGRVPAVFITRDNLKEISEYINKGYEQWTHPPYSQLDFSKYPIYHDNTNRWEVSLNIHIKVGDWLYGEPHGGWRTMSDEEFRDEYMVQDS